MPKLATNHSASSGGSWASPRYGVQEADCFFYHTAELPSGRVLDGYWDLRGRFGDYVSHTDMKGARVLDVGTASGFLTFEAEAAGAAEVVSFDLDTADRQHLLPFHNGLYVRDHAEWVRRQTLLFETWKNAYWYIHEARGSKAKVIYGDVYSLPRDIGSFDIVILGSILEHLGDPVRAIASIARVAHDVIVINTDVIESEEPIARFNGRPEHPERDYVFWTYSVETYRYILAICGFTLETVRHDTYKSRSALMPEIGIVDVPRTTLVARRIRTNREHSGPAPRA